jgi:hypothetical protein
MSQISPIPGGAAATAPAADPVLHAAVGGATPSAPSQAAPAAKTAAPAAPPTPDQRLLIQETGQVGVFVYTVIDRSSGTVVAQIPYKQVVDLGGQGDYALGQIISTQA